MGTIVAPDAGSALSARVHAWLSTMRPEWRELEAQIATATREIEMIARGNEDCQRLVSIPDIGPLTATALIAAVGQATGFDRGRDLAAWPGLVPRQHSTGGRTRLLGISKHGNPYLRQLLVHGARAVLLRINRLPEWLSYGYRNWASARTPTSSSSLWPTSLPASPGQCCGIVKHSTPRRGLWPEHISDSMHPAEVCGRTKRWHNSQPAYRQPGIYDGPSRPVSL
jgi:Transposase IS116/IS110/IS902 family